MISVGLLGTGRIGRIHGFNVASSARAKLVSVADFVTESANEFAQVVGAQVQSSGDILNDPSIDAVIICTSTDTHADIIEAAAKAGKAVFCEKPVDLDAQRIKHCLKVVESAGIPLMIGFNQRFDPEFSSLKSRVDAGEIGDIEIITIFSRDPAPPPLSYIERSGGLFRDMMIHDLDMARFLLGEEPTEVHAVGSAIIDPAIGMAGDVDTAAVLLKTASGKICQISNSRRSTYGYDQRVEIHGSRGMLRVNNIPTSFVDRFDANGITKTRYIEAFTERYARSYRNILEQFLSCLEDGVPMTPSITDGLHAQILADAATISSQTGMTQTICGRVAV
ncbi:inositol 2-dehydrogenase [Acetobacter persici]|uniref:inositol 2-dehydrogenase n=1 Tax=Acetobacter persici TaxID=1076596 RepID=UPI001EED1B95|nr:inositol 2-dehydrogenase [Acetobacter persici]MCG0999492.1 inositol 2-dehydrogenase [Acetobacter persici]